MSDPAIAARDVTVHRDHQRVLDDLSLSVPADQRVLIQGESGAGKTTLFSVLGLLERPDSGEIAIGGQSTNDLSERERTRLRRDTIGYVYQDFRLVPDLTARENAALPQDHAGERDEVWLDELFDSLDIEDVADRPPASLSGGEKQRVATARALANRPDVVLADEPTGQLDPESADSLLSLLCSLQTDLDTALVVVSHDRSLLDRFERVLVLRDSRLQRTD